MIDMDPWITCYNGSQGLQTLGRELLGVQVLVLLS